MKTRSAKIRSILSDRIPKVSLALGITFLAWVSVVAQCSNHGNGPIYQGHSLYEWLDSYQAVDRSFPLRDRAIPFQRTALTNQLNEFTAGVRQIGTNAIPCLLAWIEYEPGSAKTNTAAADLKLHQAQLSVMGFEILGGSARSACPILVRLARDPNRETVARHALEALVKIGPSSVPELVTILTDTNAPGREKVSEALGAFGTNSLSALPALLRCTSDDNEMVVIAAAVSLSEMPLSQNFILPALTNVMSDKRLFVRWGFVRSLEWHAPRAELVAPVLCHALGDSNPDIRRQAIIVLSELRPQPQSILPALTNALNDTSPSVRSTATNVLFRAFVSKSP